ncbi:MAG: hypothetical protein MRY21_00460 [Simkaniaceae bacterium]|nr:hypothetical protein [Simkaniaceae bacterium]
MNLIPFVSSILFILALSSALLFSRTANFEKQCTLYKGTLVALRNLKNAEEKSQLKTKKKSVKGTRKKPFVWHREKCFGIERSKFSLARAIEGDIQAFDLTLKVLQSLYPEHAKSMDPLLRYFQKKGKKATQITELFPDEPKLKAIFYEMLRGSKSNSPPALEDVITLQDRKPIIFATASSEVLRAAFGDDAAVKIREKERERYENNRGRRALSKQELKEIVSNFPIDELVDAKTNLKGEKVLAGNDVNTAIEIKKHLQTNHGARDKDDGILTGNESVNVAPSP